MAVYFTENRISWVYVQSLGGGARTAAGKMGSVENSKVPEEDATPRAAARNLAARVVSAGRLPLVSRVGEVSIMPFESIVKLFTV